MGADFLETLKVLAEFAVHAVSEDLGVLSIDDIALAIQEPGRDLILGGVLDYCDETFQLFGSELPGAIGGGPLAFTLAWRLVCGGSSHV
jgi:hypothetical protein